MKRGRRRRSGAMSASWHGDDEKCRGAEAKSGFRSKPRFTFNEVRVLLEAVKRSLDPLPENALMRVKPVYTYSRSNSQIYNQSSSRPAPGASSSVASAPSVFPSDSNAAPAPTSCSSTTSAVAPPSSSSLAPPTSSAVSDSAPSAAVPSSSSGASSASAPSSAVNTHSPPTSSSGPLHPPTSGSNLSDPLPGGPFLCRPQDPVAQMASQSVQQQQASRVLLTSVSQSLEILAQSVQLLVETQQEFVQESLLLQKETVDILKDFSNTALTMLRDKTNSGHLATNHYPRPPSHF